MTDYRTKHRVDIFGCRPGLFNHNNCYQITSVSWHSFFFWNTSCPTTDYRTKQYGQFQLPSRPFQPQHGFSNHISVVSTFLLFLEYICLCPTTDYRTKQYGQFQLPSRPFEAQHRFSNHISVVSTFLLFLEYICLCPTTDYRTKQYGQFQLPSRPFEAQHRFSNHISVVSTLLLFLEYIFLCPMTDYRTKHRVHIFGCLPDLFNRNTGFQMTSVSSPVREETIHVQSDHFTDCRRCRDCYIYISVCPFVALSKAIYVPKMCTVLSCPCVKSAIRLPWPIVSRRARCIPRKLSRRHWCDLKTGLCCGWIGKTGHFHSGPSQSSG